MAASSAGAFLANSLGVVLASTLSYLWTAAVLRSQPKSATWSTPEDLTDECDLWLHECAASSADGTFTHSKEEICTMASPESCLSYFEGKRSPSASNLSSYYLQRRGPTSLGGRSTRYVELTSEGLVTGKLRPSARLSWSKLGIILGWNTLGWVSAYVVCRAIMKARTRGLWAPRIANDGAGGNPVAVGGNGAGERAGMAVINSLPIADIATSAGAAGVGGCSAEDVTGVEAVIQPVSFLPGGDNYNEDHNPAIGDRDSNNNIELIDNNSTNEPLQNIRINEPVDDSGIKSGSDCSADLKPRSALPDSPFSAPVCGMSSGHVGPPPSKWRQPFPEDISAATNWGSSVSSRSQRDIGGKVRDMSGIGFSRRCKVICAINEGNVENRKRGLVANEEGTNGFDTTVAVPALAAPSPGLASPPTLRSQRPADSSSVARVETTHQSPSPSKCPSEDRSAVIPDSFSVSDDIIAGVRGKPCPANSSGAVNSMEAGRGSNHGGGFDASLSRLDPADPPNVGSHSPSAVSYSKAKALCTGSNLNTGATEDAARNTREANRRATRLLVLNQKPQTTIGFGSPTGSNTSNSAVVGPEAGSKHVNTPVSTTLASGVPLSDRTVSHANGFHASGPSAPGLDVLGSDPPGLISFPTTPSSSSSIHSANPVGLPEAFSKRTPLHGFGDFDVGVALSAGRGGVLKKYVDVDNGVRPYDDNNSTHEPLDRVDEESKDANAEPRASRAPAIDIDSRRFRFESFPLADSDRDQSRSDAASPLLSAPFCGVSPRRVVHSSSTSPPPISQDISGATRVDTPVELRSQNDIVGEEQEMPCKRLGCRYSSPLTIGEDKAGMETRGHAAQGRSSGIVESPVVVTSSAASSPGVASTSMLRRLKLACTTSVAQIKPIGQSFVPPTCQCEDKNAVESDVVLASAKTNEGVGGKPSPLNFSGAVNSTRREDQGMRTGDGRDTSLTVRRLAHRPAGLSCSPYSSTFSKLKALGKGRRTENGATEYPECDKGATGRRVKRFAEAEQQFRNLTRVELPEDAVKNNPTIVVPDVGSRHPTAPVSGAPASGLPVSDRLASQAQRLDASGYDSLGSEPPGLISFPSTPFSFSSTCSACSVGLEQGFRMSTSLHGSYDLDIGVASSAGNGGPPYHGNTSTSPFAIREGTTEKEMRRRASQGEGTRIFESPDDVTALAALSPDLASPPMLQNANRECCISVAEVKPSDQYPAPPTSRCENKDAEESDSVSVSAKTSDGVVGPPSAANYSLGVYSTGDDRGFSNGGGSEKILAIPAPAHRPDWCSSPPDATTLSKLKALGKGCGVDTGATEDLVINNRATDHPIERFAEAERDLRNLTRRGLQESAATNKPTVVGPDAGSTHSSVPVSDAPASGLPVSDMSTSQARGFDTSSFDSLGSEPPGLISFPSTPFSSSSTYSACCVGLQRHFMKPTSLHGSNDLDVRVTSSAGRSRVLTHDINRGNSGPPNRGNTCSSLLASCNRVTEKEKRGRATQGGGTRAFENPDDITVRGTLSPDLASPPTLRNAKCICSTSVVQVKQRNQYLSPPTSRCENECAVSSDSVTVSAKTSGGIGGKPSLANFSEGVNSTVEDDGSSNGGGRDATLAIPAPAHRPAGLSPPPYALTYSELKVLGKGSWLENGATEDLGINSRATQRQIERSSEAEQELRNLTRRGLPESAATNSPKVVGSDVGSTHSSAPVSEPPVSGLPILDVSASHARGCDESGYDSLGSEPPGLVSFPSTTSSSSSTYSAFSVELPEGPTRRTSQHDSHDGDVGVASSAGWHDALSQNVDGGNGRFLYDGNESGHEIMDHGVQESKGTTAKPRASRARSMGIDVDRLRSAIADEKGALVRQLSSAETALELDGHTRSGGIGGCVVEDKRATPFTLSLPEEERGLTPLARSDFSKRRVAEEKGPCGFRISPSNKNRDLDNYVIADLIDGSVTEENGTPTTSTTTSLLDRHPNPNHTMHHDHTSSASRLPCDDNHKADRNPTVSDCKRKATRKGTDSNDNSNIPGGNNNGIALYGRSGGGLTDDLKPCSTVSARPSPSAPLRDVSPRCTTPSRTKSLPSFRQDIKGLVKGNSSLRSRSQSEIGGKEQETSGRGQGRRCSFPSALDKGMTENEKRGRAPQSEGTGTFESPDAVTAIAALSPGLASPVIFRNAKVAYSTSVAQVKPINQFSLPSASRYEDKNTVASNPTPLSVTTSEGVRCQPGPANSCRSIKSMITDEGSNNRSGRDTSLATPAPAYQPARLSCSPSASISSRANTSGKGSRHVNDAIEDFTNNMATGRRVKRFSEVVQEPRGKIRADFPGAGSTRLNAPSSAAPASRSPVSDRSAYQARDLEPRRIKSFTGTPSSSSSTYSTCRVAPPERVIKSISLGGLSGTDVGMALSAVRGGAVTLNTHCGKGKSPHDGNIFGHEMQEDGVEESKGDSMEPRPCWAAPIGINGDGPGFKAFLLAESDEGHPRSDGVDGADPEEKGASAYKISPAENKSEFAVHARLEGIGGGIIERKRSPVYDTSSAEEAKTI